MRIALFAWESLHSIALGGVGVHVTELAAALERRRHEVHVFTRQAAGQSTYESVDGVHYHRSPFPISPSMIDEVDDMCRSFVDHCFEVEDSVGPFDVLHAHDWLAAKAAAWAKQGRSRRAVLTMHSTEYGRNGNHHYCGMAARVQDHERHGTSCADRVITLSHELKRELGSLYELPEHKVSVIYNGVNTHAFEGHVDTARVKQRYGIGPLEPMVLFVGQLVVQKGPDVLLCAAPKVLRLHPSAKLVLVGDGHMRGDLQALAHHLGVAHAVRLLGHRSGHERIELFKSCDLLAVPSRNEPFGIVILEAWSASRPVVCTRRGIPAEFVRHGITGLQIDDSVDSVSWGIGTLLADDERGRWMGHNGRAAVDAIFGWDRIAEQTEEVYQSIC